MSLEKKVKKAEIQKIILKTIKLAGMISVATIAPNVLSAMKKLGLITHPRQIESIKRSRDKLVEKGLLDNKNGQLKITQHGKRYLFKCLTLGENKELNKKKKWDGKWRVLVFDIPEIRRFDRDSIRYALVSIGFMRLQDSVWIYPYNCEDLISLLKADTETDDNVLYMIVEAIENDEPIKKYFGLK
jgi:Phenylacetic acid-responsive transcriptional repressor